MEGQSFLTVNPDTLCNEDIWPYRDLQRLCKKLEIGGKGGRRKLVTKLQNWHRERSEVQPSCWHDQENIPMNVEGNNFALLDLKEDFKSLNAANHVISTDYINRYDRHDEFKPTRGAFTTGRSILKKNTTSGEYFMQTKPSRLSFSPFNGVKIIPHRYDLHKVSHKLFAYDDDSDDSFTSN